MAKGCCRDCTWRCPRYDSKKCFPCKADLNKPNFESEEYPGFGTKAAAAIPMKDQHPIGPYFTIDGYHYSYKPNPNITKKQVRELAKKIWEYKGRPQGMDLEIWNLAVLNLEFKGDKTML